MDCTIQKRLQAAACSLVFLNHQQACLLSGVVLRHHLLPLPTGPRDGRSSVTANNTTPAHHHADETAIFWIRCNARAVRGTDITSWQKIIP
ncbi:hypothetical protein BaRGS_00035790 [Batillaria attramentaria]|uniref:Secreted protein n=1 Tax=Batillaria attramentaria TaxID=370345 RepID=A0ABD0JDF9_9CAEN